MSALRFEGVGFALGDATLLDGISLEVKPNELWALLGPNGAGKSTLLKVAMGLNVPSRGRVFVNGADVAALPRKQLAQQLAWVPQSPAEDTGFTALELVLMGRAPHLGTLGLPTANDVARAQELLSEVGLGALATRPLDAMSGGERRLCYLARARMQQANVLLFDEPTAFLDLKHQVECLRQLRAMAAAGAGALAVLHDVNLAVQWATHAALLRGGKLLAAGPARDVLEEKALSGLYGVSVRATAGGLFSAGEQP
jgi:iron complex transport system ATP-binding protein